MNDQNEINNLVKFKKFKKEVKILLLFFINERRGLLKKRNVKVNLKNLNNLIEA